MTTKLVQALAVSILLGATIAIGSGCGQSTTDGDTGGEGGDDDGGCAGADCPVACPTYVTDQQVRDLESLHCSAVGTQCNSVGSDNGCGYCSVTCTEDGWKASDDQICHPPPFGC